MFIEYIAKSAIQDGELLVRGTIEWDDRETERTEKANAWCRSFGSLEMSLKTNGRSSRMRFYSPYLPGPDIVSPLYNSAR